VLADGVNALMLDPLRQNSKLVAQNKTLQASIAEFEAKHGTRCTEGGELKD